MRGSGSSSKSAASSNSQEGYVAMPSAPPMPTEPATANVLDGDYNVPTATIVGVHDSSDGKKAVNDFSDPPAKVAAATLVTNEEPNGNSSGAVQESIGTIFSERISSTPISVDRISSDGISCAPISSAPISANPISAAPISAAPITTPYTQFAVAPSDGSSCGGMGFALEKRGGALVVSELAAGGAAADSGQIEIGDVLRTIDGDKASLGNALEKLDCGPAGESLTLVFERSVPDSYPTFNEVALTRR